jgi:hypothetical protein
MTSFFAPELQLELDDVYACPGKCPGCVLTPLERKGQEADMSEETRTLILQSLRAYIPTLSNLQSMNFTYGIADHLLMELPYLERIVLDANQLFLDVGLQDTGSIFLSTSLIGKSELLVEKMQALSRLQTRFETRLSLLVVLDPAKLLHQTFGDNYRTHVETAKTLFSSVDLSINLSQAAVEQLSPEALVTFAQSYGFHEVTVNWTPTPDNLSFTYSLSFMPQLTDWLLRFAALSKEVGLSSSYVPVIQKAYTAWRCASDAESADEGAWLPLLSSLLPETLSKSLQFDHHGQVFPKWEAVGDVPHNNRFSFADWGNVREAPLTTLVARGIQQSTRAVVHTLRKAPSCQSCSYAGLCATTGFHIYTHVLPKSHDCPHVAKALFLGLQPDTART